MQADPKHQQDHAELGELPDSLYVAYKAGGERADRDTGQKIPNQGGKPDPARDDAADEGHNQSDGDLDQQPDFMHVRHLE